MLGCDVAHYQSSIPAGVDFVIIKATQGTTIADSAIGRHTAAAKARGLLRGYYHFVTTADPVAQADWFLAHVPDVGRVVLALDFENTTNSNVRGRADLAKAFLDRVHARTGVRPLIYMNGDILGSANWSAVAKDYPLWLARYTASAGSVAPWPSWTLWQYTSSNGAQDYNRAAIDAVGWAALASGTSLAGNTVSATPNLPTIDVGDLTPIAPQEDDMFTDDDRARMQRIETELGNTKAGVWTGGAVTLDGVAQTFAYGALPIAAHNQALIAQVLGELAGLRTALESLSGSGAVDLAAITKAAQDGANAALAGLTLTAATGGTK